MRIAKRRDLVVPAYSWWVRHGCVHGGFPSVKAEAQTCVARARGKAWIPASARPPPG